MSKNKLPHLSLVSRESGFRGWSLNFTRPYDRGPAVSANIERGLELTGLRNKSELIDRAIEAFVNGLKAQSRLEQILDYCDDVAQSDVLSAQALPVIEVIRKLGTGCPVKNETVFTGELSQEYLERYGDE